MGLRLVDAASGVGAAALGVAGTRVAAGRVGLAQGLGLVQARALVVAVAVLMAVIIVVAVVGLRVDPVVALRFLLVFAFARRALVLVSGGSLAWADAVLLRIGVDDLPGPRGPLGDALSLVLLDVLVN